MKKNRLIILIIIALVLVAALFIFYKFYQTEPKIPDGYTNFIENPTVGTVPPAIIDLPKPIALEFMTAKEKEEFSINTSTIDKIQVLKRDKDGNVMTYRIIKNDSDILTEY